MLRPKGLTGKVRKVTLPKIPTLARLGMAAQSFTENGRVYGPIVGMGESFCVFRIAGGDVGTRDYEGTIGNVLARPWHRIELTDVQPDPAQLKGGR